MNAHVKTPAAAEEQVPALVEVTEQTAAEVLKDGEKFEAFYRRVESATQSLVPDVTTKEGREAIASMAYKVSKTKTAIDKIRLKITEDWRKQVEDVNKAGKTIVARLDALRDQVRAPLSAWEDAEKARQDEADAILTFFREAVNVRFGDTSEAVAARLAEVKAKALPSQVLREQLDEAMTLQGAAIAALTEAHANLVQEEADKRELAELRASRSEPMATTTPLPVQAEAAPAPVADRGHATQETLADLQQRAGLTAGQARAVVMAVSAGSIRHLALKV